MIYSITIVNIATNGNNWYGAVLVNYIHDESAYTVCGKHSTISPIITTTSFLNFFSVIISPLFYPNNSEFIILCLF